MLALRPPRWPADAPPPANTIAVVNIQQIMSDSTAAKIVRMSSSKASRKPSRLKFPRRKKNCKKKTRN